MMCEPIRARQLQAFDRLSLGDRRRVRAARGRLQQLWLHEEPLLELARCLQPLICDSAVCTYQRDIDGRVTVVVHSLLGEFSRSFTHVPGMKALGRHFLYHTERPDEHTNRPVNTETLYRGKAEKLADYRSAVLGPNGFWYQLRTAFHDRRGRFVGHCAFVRSRAGGEFDEAEGDLFATLLPELLDGYETLWRLGSAHLDERTLGACLEAFDEPAYLVRDEGSIEHANGPARGLPGARPPWLDKVLAGDDAEAPARVTRLLVEGRELLLMVPREDFLPVEKPPTLDDLPRRLERVARLVAEGLVDKEIAERLELSNGTVRAYVSTALSILHLESRAALAARFGG